MQSLGAWFWPTSPSCRRTDRPRLHLQPFGLPLRHGRYCVNCHGDHMPLHQHILMTHGQIAGHCGALGASNALHLLRTDTQVSRPERARWLRDRQRQEQLKQPEVSRQRQRSAFAAHLSEQAASARQPTIQAMGEFDLIARYFTRPVATPPWAWATTAPCWPPRPGMHLATSSDMLVGRPPLLCRQTPRPWAKAPGPSTCRTWPPAGPGPPFTLALALPGSMKPGWLVFPGFAGAGRCTRGCELVGG